LDDPTLAQAAIIAQNERLNPFVKSLVELLRGKDRVSAREIRKKLDVDMDKSKQLADAMETIGWRKKRTAKSRMYVKE
jgi:hypothetical protein